MNLAGYEATPAEEVEAEAGKKEPIKDPQPKATTPKTHDGIFTFNPKTVGSKPDKNGKDRFTVKLPNGDFAATYNKEFYDKLLAAKESGMQIVVETIIQGAFINIVDVREPAKDGELV